MVSAVVIWLTLVPEPSIVHKLVQDVKLSSAATPAPAAPMRYVGSCPDGPVLFGEECLQKAYGDGKSLLSMPEEYQSLLMIVPWGSTSKMLSKGQKSATVDRSSDPCGSADQSGMHGNNLLHGMQGMSGMNGFPVGIMQFASMMSLLVNSHKHGHEVQHDNPQPASKKQGALALADAGPPKPYGENLPLTEEKASMQLELANVQPKLRSKAKSDSSPEGPEEEKQDDPAEKTCAAAEALKNRSTKKQEAQKDSTAAGKSKGKGEKDKGEQNKGKGMKRPAAAMAKTEEEFQYECPSPGSTWVTRNKESWKSKHYHSARDQALKCEKTREEALPCARVAYKKAAEKWYKKYNE